jgi:hypothetical protein
MVDIKATYSYEVFEGYLFIEDLCEDGKLSVTMDMENVLKSISEEIGDEITKLQVLYKDSQGVWDGVKFKIDESEESRIVISEFVILNCESLEDAVGIYSEQTSESDEKYLFDVQ